MTETNHSQESVIALPDKWFRLDEVAKRWSVLTGQIVTVDRLLHFADTKALRIEAFLPYDSIENNIGVWCIPKGFDKGFNFIEPSFVDFIDPNESRETIFSGTLFPYSYIAKHLRYTDSMLFSFVKISSVNGLPYDRDLFFAWFKYKHHNNRAKVKCDDLRITRVELERFEQKHGLGKPAPMPTINEDTELKRAYRALGALAMQLASDKPKFMNGNKPNVSQIAEYALNAVSDSQDEAPHGYSNTTLRDAIATALNTVNKDLSNR